MRMKKQSEKEVWNKVKGLMGDSQIKLGGHWSFNLYNDPKRLVFVLSRYKFAAKMGAKNKRVLELGCSEGIGATILSEFALNYTGVDMDREAIQAAKKNWAKDKMIFIEDDFLGKSYGRFDTVVSLDVVEHITSDYESLFFETIYKNLSKDGIGIVGTPNVTASSYASVPSKEGHVNLFDAERLRNMMQKLFYNVFVFGSNDEIVHTGFPPMSHYLICIGCYKKSKKEL
jgi:2-polyprenyl-3-methyl-5-hydroxy-6-metoxy-1,4-benzoquinol methylase